MSSDIQQFFFISLVKTMLKDCFINIGEVKASNKPVMLKCHGIGSCIGLFLFDRVNKVGGGAHILLPEVNSVNEISQTLHAEGAIVELLSQIASLGGDLNTLRAVVVGGSNVLQQSYTDIGRQNREKVIKLLINNRIYISKEETGGKITRSVSFSTIDGSCKILSQK